MPKAIEGFGVYNEWGPLREVIVGRMDTTVFPEYTPALDVSGPAVTDLLKKHGGRRLDEVWPEMAEAGQQGLDQLAATYERYGVTVHRPRELSELEAQHLRSLATGVWQTNPADSIWVIGRHVIECQLRVPMLRKQNFTLREPFYDHLLAHGDSRWVQIPNAMPTEEDRYGPGPYLEGGDILILGDDVLVGVDLDGFSTDETGAEWLRRYLADDGFRVTPVPFRNAVKIHLLAHVGVPREGVAIIYKPLFTEGIPEPIADWDLIEISEEESAKAAACIVALDSDRCLLPAETPRIAEELAKRGIEPVTVPYEATAFWGGGIRCGTIIVRRDP